MIFSTGSTFIFGSWIYEAGNDGKLQSHLLEDSDHLEDLSFLASTTNQLIGRFAQLVMSDPTQISRLCASNSNLGSASEMESYPSFFKKPSSFLVGFQNAASVIQEFNSEYTQSLFKKSDPFSFGLDKMTKSYQARLEGSLDPVLRMPLK